MKASMNTTVLNERRPQGCDVCGKVKELRPYGLNGKWVCFCCGMKNEGAAKMAFEKRRGRGDERLGDVRS